jgi:hypothetical protein
MNCLWANILNAQERTTRRDGDSQEDRYRPVNLPAIRAKYKASRCMERGVSKIDLLGIPACKWVINKGLYIYTGI